MARRSWLQPGLRALGVGNSGGRIFHPLGPTIMEGEATQLASWGDWWLPGCCRIGGQQGPRIPRERQMASEWTFRAWGGCSRCMWEVTLWGRQSNRQCLCHWCDLVPLSLVAQLAWTVQPTMRTLRRRRTQVCVLGMSMGGVQEGNRVWWLK